TGLDDSPARGARRDIARENGEPVITSLIGVACRTIDDHPGHATQLRREREVASPARRIHATALLEDDDVAGLRRLNRGRTEMPRSRRAAVVFFELHCDDAPRDPAISRQPVNAGGHAGELQLVERVRHRARIETAETRDLIVHVSCVVSGFSRTSY